MTDEQLSSWQAELEARFAPRIDSALIAAIVSEPGQTLDGAAAILETLSFSAAEHENNNKTQDLGPTNTAEHQVLATDHAVDSEVNAKEASGEDEESEQVRRALEEWSLIDKDQQPLADGNLRLTDDEQIEGEEEEDEEREGKEGNAVTREAQRVGRAVADEVVDPGEIAAGDASLGPPGESATEGSGLDLLTHAFPARTPLFLEETLRECNGDVTQTLDHLMVLEMVENGEASADLEWSSNSGSLDGRALLDDEKSRKGGIDYEKLSQGLNGGRKKMSKNERKRLRQRQVEGAYSAGPQKISLGDVRQGVTVRAPHHQPVRRTGKKALDATGVEEDDATLAARLDKEEREAAGLTNEEDSLVKDNDWLFSSSILDQMATLLDLPSHKTRAAYHATSFNLRAAALRLVVGQAQQYPTLAALDEHLGQEAGTSQSLVDNLCALSPVHRTVEDVVQAFKATAARPDATLDLLDLLDVVQEAAPGSKTDILDPMARNSTRKDAVAVDIATKTQTAGPNAGAFVWTGEDDKVNGRPAYSGVTKRNINPMQQAAQNGSMKTDEGGRVSNRTAIQALRSGAASTSYPATHASSSSQAASSLSDGAQYSSDPLARGGVYFSDPTSNQVVSSAQKRAQECKAISEDYRARREECLRKASSAYRNRTSLPASVTRAGVGRGASAAWYYADEARRLDAKARAWSLRAAQALVQERVHMSRSGGSGATGGTRAGGDRIDLHGLTVHEALTITRDALAAWWGKRDSGNKMPLTIVTGVGRHSRGNVAVIRPAVLGMLKRDGWRIDENAGQGLVTVRGVV